MIVLVTRAKTVRNMEVVLARELHMAGTVCHDYVGCSQGTLGGLCQTATLCGTRKDGDALACCLLWVSLLCSAWRLTGTPCAVLICDSGGRGLAIIHGWLHVPHTVLFWNSEMTNVLGCDHPHCSATCWSCVRLVKLAGTEEPLLRDGAGVPISMGTSPLVPLGFRNCGWFLVHFCQNRFSLCDMFMLCFQSAHGFRSLCLKLANPGMLWHHFVLSPLLLCTFHWESCRADLGNSSFWKQQ